MRKPSSIDRAQAFRYMGMQHTADAQLSALADVWEKQLLSGSFPNFVYRVYPLRFLPEGILCEGSRLLLTGNDIRKHLSGCKAAALMCVTLGQKTEQIIRLAQATDMTAGMLTDAMASAYTEQICDAAQDCMTAELSEYYHTWRFSPGYGDLPLSVQGDFLAAVNAEKRLGVTLSDGGMLVPAKSVTAIIGLSETPVPKGKMGCAGCNMNQTCPYRAKGEHCK